MIQVFLLCLLLFYFWYFYSNRTEAVSKPVSPSNPKKYVVKFSKLANNTFQFSVNHTVLWQHTLPNDKYRVQSGTLNVVERDACENVPHGNSIPATGQALYDYLKMNPDMQQQLAFQQDTPFLTNNQGAFYFTCMSGRIRNVGICPSGQYFRKSKCVPINRCTGKPDGTTLPDFASPKHYLRCRNGREFSRYCGNDRFFVHDRCVSQNDMAYYCQYNDKPLKLDDVTKLECVNGKPVYTTCKPGTKFFENEPTLCEPTDCVGKADGEKLPLPTRTIGPLHFSPGYLTCFSDKVHETIECPQVWDDKLTQYDNLTHLPMVFDGRRCAAPTFCENVFSDDPDVLVPLHDYTKFVRNWQFSDVYDRISGYTCQGKKRKLVHMEPGHYINKHFKRANACDDLKVSTLPIPETSDKYYDCAQGIESTCPPSTFFNGNACVNTPNLPNTFMYRNIPMFKFDSLNHESWITPWNYKRATQANACQAPDKYLKLYDICSNPDCEKYSFLSMIPDLAILLPEQEHGKFKCKFYEADQTLRKEPVNYDYSYWDQKILRQHEQEDAVCVPGQKLNTGNFIWDKTVYATCDDAQPFVFCPSPITLRIEKYNDIWYCVNNYINTIVFDELVPVTFSDNEIKRILPINMPTHFRINNGSWQALTPGGYVVPKGTQTYTLQVQQPVRLELRYRVTHPPNIAYNYENGLSFQTHPEHGFIVKRENFTALTLNFPRYTPIKYVESFTDQHLT